MPEPASFDLPAYLARIRYPSAPRPDLATLAGLHAAHAASIPFENLDVRLGRPVGLDLDSLQAKLVRGQRGGYCFEHNALFAAALAACGFEVATLEARVRPPGATTPLPRTHMVLRVAVDGHDWLADVGFGGDGPLRPVPFDGTPSSELAAAYRLSREPQEIHVLQLRRRDAWADLYAFGLTPALAVDYAVAHHYTSTHPRSPFVTGLTVQLNTPAGRHILRGRTYTLRRGDQEAVRELAVAEVPGLLRETFGLEVSDEEVEAALAGA